MMTSNPEIVWLPSENGMEEAHLKLTIGGQKPPRDVALIAVFQAQDGRLALRLAGDYPDTAQMRTRYETLLECGCELGVNGLSLGLTGGTDSRLVILKMGSTKEDLLLLVARMAELLAELLEE